VKIRGEIVDILVEVSPEIYGNYVFDENGHIVLYVQMLKALYVIIITVLQEYP